MDEMRQGAASAPGSESDANVTRSIVGRLRARDVNMNGSGAGLVAVERDLSILNGGCGPVLAKGSVAIRNGGCGPLIAGGDVSIENGGTQAIISAGVASIGPNALVGLVASPRVTVAEGGRVLLSSKQALVFGAAAGIACSLLSRLLRR